MIYMNTTEVEMSPAKLPIFQRSFEFFWNWIKQELLLFWQEKPCSSGVSEDAQLRWTLESHDLIDCDILSIGFQLFFHLAKSR